MIFKKQDHLVNNFTIYGERHSGTNLLENICRNSLGLDITWEFGWKHFFGFTNDSVLAKSKNTLFFCIVRNPYDWIMAMHTTQYHIPIKNQNPKEIFLFNEWYSVDSYGQEIESDRHYVSNRRYKNIFEMRKSKLQYMINHMPIICNNLCITTYEHITDHPLSFIKMVGKIFNIDIDTNNIPLIWNRERYDMPKNIKSAIDTNIDWELEDYFGYKPITNLVVD